MSGLELRLELYSCSLSVRVRAWGMCYVHKSPFKHTSLCLWYFNTLSSPTVPRIFPNIISCWQCFFFSMFVKALIKATDKACYLPELGCLCSSLLSGDESSSGNMFDAHDCLKSPLLAMTLFLLLSPLTLTNNPPNRRWWALPCVGVLFSTNFPNRSLCSASEHTGNDHRFPSVLNLAP